MASDRFFLQHLVVEPGSHCLTQPETAAELRNRLAELADAKSALQLLEFVYTQSAIEKRYFEFLPAEAAARTDWYRAHNEATYALAARALDRLFQETSGPTCDGLVVATSSYNGFPALSRRLQARFRLPLEAPCFDIAGLGCGAPTHALAVAHALLEQGTCRTVCVLAADTMGTFSHMRRHLVAPSMPQLVAHCLASDAAAALLLSRMSGERPAFSYAGCRLKSRLWPESLDQNDYAADEHNQPFMLVGPAIRHRVGEELELLLGAEGLQGPVVMHPGGAAVMRRLRDRHPGMGRAIDLALSVIVSHGNVGAPSVLWVLEEALRTGAELSPTFNLVALAPGIVSTGLLFHDVGRTRGAA
jgi:alkylresorcinol/alkylpyrone synthase